ncbi:5-methyltetrahydropteroyltriglutamate--homocysteine S-methyltransferase [Candidatus Woesearchaeota archaeon]|nr:5-methyltetrahydropteroyltriglutamate--homocysteine S-methyltransferase [Candidatus Woesearchaeota archaeon]
MQTTNSGFPNVYGGLMKKAVESFWRKEASLQDVEHAFARVVQYNAGVESSLDLIPVFDCDIYDRMLKTAVMFGIVPGRFGTPQLANDDLATYLSIPRGTRNSPASPMVKWFNTNYHVVQPEIEHAPKLIKDHVTPALRLATEHAQGKIFKPVLIGPWTLLSYAMNKTDRSEEALFDALSGAYADLINNLAVPLIQLEEPSFLTRGIPGRYADFLRRLRKDVHLYTYFGSVSRIADDLFSLPVEGFGLDFVDGAADLEYLNWQGFFDLFNGGKKLIAGIINGRNVWKVNGSAVRTLEYLLDNVSEENLILGPSCSLVHVPLSIKNERPELHDKFSFAVEKLAELESLRSCTLRSLEAAKSENRKSNRQPSAMVERNTACDLQSIPCCEQGRSEQERSEQERSRSSNQEFHRSARTLWESAVEYPLTTIGSFPQTSELRSKRASYKSGKISPQEYDEFIKGMIRDVIALQEKLGIDVIVHGEFEREDMVQYFARQLDGFTEIASPVQSYGTRMVRPPVITGNVNRKAPMTLEWITYAQSLTKKPVKGILTGPATMLQWAYPREDISRSTQMYQIARALRDEVNELYAAGIRHIQIDEPALREGLPLERREHEHYLWHATNAFRLCAVDLPADAVLHTHMCFSEFKEIIEAIKSLEVDVISIEESKSQGKVARFLQESGFTGGVGLGVFDVHSPRVPPVEEMLKIPASLSIDAHRIWINPDCGLKTRTYDEAKAQLDNMVEVARHLRQKE